MADSLEKISVKLKKGKLTVDNCKELWVGRHTEELLEVSLHPDALSMMRASGLTSREALRQMPNSDRLREVLEPRSTLVFFEGPSASAIPAQLAEAMYPCHALPGDNAPASLRQLLQESRDTRFIFVALLSSDLCFDSQPPSTVDRDPNATPERVAFRTCLAICAQMGVPTVAVLERGNEMPPYVVPTVTGPVATFDLVGCRLDKENCLLLHRQLLALDTGLLMVSAAPA